MPGRVPALFVTAVVLAAMACLSSLTAPAWAQLGGKKKGDERVEKLLKELELKFEVDKDGDFKMINGLADDRSQIAWVLSKTNQLGDLEIREVWSLAILQDDPLEADVANKLLELNAKYKLGAWQVRKMGGKFAAIFAAQIAADCDKDTLLTCVQAVTRTADEVEKELTSEDKF